MVAEFCHKVSTRRFSWYRCPKFSLSFNRSRSDRSELASPPGFNPNIGHGHSEISQEVDSNLIVKKSWDIALAPLKQIPMNLFIMYMAGNSISIFPIMMVGMLFLGPIKAIFNFNNSNITNNIFETFVINELLFIRSF